jgi:hypothetical protein
MKFKPGDRVVFIDITKPNYKPRKSDHGVVVNDIDSLGIYRIKWDKLHTPTSPNWNYIFIEKDRLWETGLFKALKE